MFLLHLLHLWLSPYFFVFKSFIGDSDFKIRLMNKYEPLHTQLQTRTYYAHTNKIKFY